MPKMKSNRSLMKRIKVTGNGKIKFIHAYKGHHAPYKTPKQCRQLRRSGMMDRTDYKRIKYMIVK
ncbi:MAG TPA: 50S ribosomal protein L35 [Firmicutes bacterium]|nr:50S ribosomal protein L35 [Bacillota bacterium]HBM70507.1 50S ribosomal protein L35 [Bacillota bacterium]HBX25498.1 50S ribosomal protein L35 [Bacillota bacterium]